MRGDAADTRRLAAAPPCLATHVFAREARDDADNGRNAGPAEKRAGLSALVQIDQL